MPQDPVEVAKLWAQNTGRSTEKARMKVQQLTESPTMAAAREADRYVQGVQNNVAKWRRNLQAVPLSDWQEAYLGKGLRRISEGATAAIPKMQAFLTQWLPYEEQLKAKIKAMPKGTLEDSKARAIAAIEHNAAFRKR